MFSPEGLRWVRGLSDPIGNMAGGMALELEEAKMKGVTKDAGGVQKDGYNFR